MPSAARRSFVKKAQAILGLVVFAVLFATPSLAATGIAPLVSYQARLMDPSGFPVADGTYSVRFSLYDAPTGGNRVWTASGTLATPTAISVSVQNGLFSILLGDTGQNTLDTVDWNQDALYLGVTIDADAEMSPRRRLGSAPQAFNARQLQGMYASSTAFGSDSLFVINQTSNTAATGTRTALEVRSSGTSNDNDFLFRAVNDLANTVFSINREGNVTTTGNLVVSGTASTSQLFVAGQLVCLANGTNCAAGGGSNWLYDGAEDFLRPNTSTSDVVIGGTSTTVGFMNSLFGLNGGSLFVANNIGSASSIYTNGAFVAGTGTTFYADGYLSSSLFDVRTSGGAVSLSPSSTQVATFGYDGILLTPGKNTLGGGGDIDAMAADATIGSGGNGGNISFDSGTGDGAGSGGQLNLTTGDGGASGDGGTLSLTSGSGGANGGQIVLTGGQASGGGGTFGGIISLFAGDGIAGSLGGNINLAAGDSVGALGGSVNLTPGSGGSFGAVNLLSAGGISSSELRFWDDGDTNYVGLKAASGIDINWFLTLPRFDGVSGTVLATDGAGALSFIDVCHADGTNCEPTVSLEIVDTVSVSNPVDVDVVGQYAYSINQGNRTLSVIDVSSPDNAVIVGTANLAFSSSPSDLFVAGDYAYVTNGSTSNTLLILDISSSTNPVTVASQGVGADPNAVYVSGGYAYVTNAGTNNLSIIDVSNPAAPFSVATTTVGTEPTDVFVAGDYAYVINFDGELRIIDVSNPASPSTVDTVTGLAQPSELYVANGYAYVANSQFGNNTMSIIDVSDPANGLIVTSTYAGLGPLGITVAGQYAYITNTHAGGSHISVVNIVDPLHPTYVSLNEVGSAPLTVAVSGRYVYVANGFFTDTVTIAEIKGDNTTNFYAVQGDIDTLRVTQTLTVAGQLVCLANGTNCPAGGGDVNWLYDGAEDFLRPNTSTSDVVIGGTSTTVSFMNSLFALNGGSLFVANNIGSASSIYTNGAFVAGPGSTHYGDGYINKTNGNLILAASGGAIVPQTNNSLSLGTVSTSFANIYASGTVVFASASGSILDLMPRSAPSLVSSIFTDGVTQDVVVSGRYAYTAEDNQGLRIYDISNPQFPVEIGAYNTPGFSYCVAVAGKYAYVADDTSIQIIDVSRPTQPTLAGSFSRNGMNCLFLSGNNLYVSNFNLEALDIFDVSDPTAPQLMGTVSTAAGGANEFGLYVQGRYAYLADGTAGLHIIDVSSSTNPVLVSTFDSNGSALHVEVSGRYAYLADYGGGFDIIDVSSSTNPVLVGEVSSLTQVGDVELAWPYAYLLDDTLELTVVDVTSSTNPTIVTNAAPGGNPFRLTVSGRYAYVAYGLSGILRVFDLGGLFTPVATIGSLNASNASIYDDLDVGNVLSVRSSLNVGAGGIQSLGAISSAAVDATSTIAGLLSVGSLLVNDQFVCLEDGTNCPAGAISNLQAVTNAGATTTNTLELYGGFLAASSTVTSTLTVLGEARFASSVEAILTSSSQANFVANIAPASTFNNPQDIEVVGKHLFVTQNAGTSFEIYDISQPENASSVASVTFANNNPSSVHVVGRYAYLVSEGVGPDKFTVIDLEAPNGPAVVGSLDRANVGDVYVSGGYAYVAKGVGAFDVIDVRDPTSPVLAATVTGLSGTYRVTVSGRYAYVTDIGSGQLRIFDVSHPTNPTLLSSYGTVAANDVEVQGRYAYVTGNDSLSVLDITNPNAPIGVATTTGLTGADALVIHGRTAYIRGNSEIHVVDIENPLNPQHLFSFNNVLSIPTGLAVSGRYVYVADVGTDTVSVFRLNGMETNSLMAHTAEAGSLQVLTNAWIGNQLSVGSDLAIGRGGILSLGALTVSATGTTSTIGGSLLVGSSVYDGALNALFTMNGNDLYVGGNIGSASSVYTNGSFVVGSGSTHYSDGLIRKTDGNLTFSVSGGLILPETDNAISLGTTGQRWGNAWFAGTASSTHLVATNTVTSSWYGFANTGGIRWQDLGSSFVGLTQGTVNWITVSAGNGRMVLNNARTGSSGLIADVDGVGSIGISSNRFLNGWFTGTVTTTLLDTTDLRVSGSVTTTNLAASGQVSFLNATGSSLTLLNPTNPTSAGLIDTTGTAMDVAVSDGYAYVADLTNGLQVFDVSNPLNPRFVSGTSLGTSDEAWQVKVAGKYAYVAYTDAGLRIYDVSDPSSPTAVGFFDDPSCRALGLYVSGKYAYVGCNSNGFVIVDISDPRTPRQVSRTTGLATSWGVFVQGKYAYVAIGTEGMTIFDVSIPEAPVRLGTIDSAGTVAEVRVSGRYAYLAQGGSSPALAVIDVADPDAPVQVATTTLSGTVWSIDLAGNYAYIGNFGDGVRVINVSNPLDPRLVSTFVGTSLSRGISVVGKYAYVGESTAGLRVIDLQGADISTARVGDLQAGSASVLTDLEVGNSLFVRNSLNLGSGGLFSDGGLHTATGTTSTIMGNLLVGTSTAYSIHPSFLVDGNDLFVAGNIGSASSVFTNGAFVAGTGTTMFGDGFINRTGGDLTLNITGGSIVPSSDLGVALGSESLRFNAVLGSVTATTLNVAGQHVCLADGTNCQTLTVQPEVTTQATITGISNARSVAVRGRYAYALDAGTDLLRVYDVSSPAAPRLVTSTALNASSFAVDLVIRDNYLFIASSSGGSTALQIYELQENGFPIFVRLFGLNLGGASRLALGQRTLYVLDTANIDILDISDINNITNSSTISVPDVVDFTVHNGLLYVVQQAVTERLKIYSLANELSPNLLSDTAISTDVRRIQVLDGKAYLSFLTTGAGEPSIEIYDVSNPHAPSQLGSLGVGLNPTSVPPLEVSGRYVYLGRNDGSNGFLHVIDVASSTAPVNISTSTFSSSIISRFAVQGNHIYMHEGSRFQVLSIGGYDLPGITAGQGEFGTLAVRGSGYFEDRLTAGGGLVVGGEGIMSAGPLIIDSYSTTTWGAYIDQLLVGTNPYATGTSNYSMVLTYASSATLGGLCIDDTGTAATCPTNVGGASIMSDGTVISNGFDLAETYNMSGTAEPGDLLILDETSSSTVKRSAGIPYDPKLIGIVSSDPGFVLGWQEGARVALTGRVPTKVAMTNGSIRVGDPLTSSDVPGYAMKATKPGMIVGYALEDMNATGTIEVFVDVGYYAGMTLGTDGAFSTLNDDLVFTPRTVASSTNAFVDSWGFTFRGSVWDSGASSVVHREFSILTDVISSTSSLFTIRNASGTNLFTMDEGGNAQIAGDLAVGGRLYPSSRGAIQTDYYIFLDDQAPTGTYIATNADGWQSLDTYDFAERFYSPDELEPGDLVVVKNTGNHHVQRSWNEDDLLVGIVSTRPAFIAGRPATNTHPIALSGRVPTKVSTLKGSIAAGDPLAPSTIPGVAVKATKTGPIVGLALEDYAADAIGLIEVNVNPGWWTAPEIDPTDDAVSVSSGVVRRGLAKIEAGAQRVTVSYESIGSYPFVQVTPRGLIVGTWGTDHYTDVSFDILLAEPQSFDVYFSWEVEPLQSGDRLYQSDGTYLDLNEMTGEPLGVPADEEPIEESVVEESPVVEESEVVSEQPVETDNAEEVMPEEESSVPEAETTEEISVDEEAPQE